MSVEGNVDLSRVRKKLEEAGFFLSKMSEQEQRLTGHRVPFDYYLSAFLSAGRTVDCRLCHEHKAIYKPWRKAWNARITPDENRLIKFMVDDRNDEVHESGSSRTVGEKGVPLPVGRYQSRRDGIFFSDDVVGSSSPNLIFRPSYSFTIDRADCEATEACRKYLALLQRMVAEFEADHP
jgi:hypothetical protein